jgi:hypothetical protein
MRVLILPPILPLLLAMPALAQTAAPAAPETRTCLQVPHIQSSNVVNSQTIDFRLRDGSVWRNHLARRCPGLGFDRAFTYTTSIPQLCNVDIIRVIVQGNPGITGATCGLGKFERQPPAPAKSKAGAGTAG